jgi:dihydrofolate reductase
VRKIVFMMSVSLDGFFEGPSRELDWQIVDEELHAHFNSWLGQAGAFLDGRVTYELMADFWPTADQEPDASPVMAEFAGIWRDMPKIVFSRTLESVGGNVTLARDVDPDEIRALQATPGGDLVLGGADLAATFRQLDLIDEYRFYVHPVLLGRGNRLFGDPIGEPVPASVQASVQLRLAETRTFGSGVVLLRYER